MEHFGTASAELQRLLTIAPPSLVDNIHHHPSQQIQNHNPTTIAHAALQALRDSGDQHLLFLRTILEFSSVTINNDTMTALLSNEELFFHCVTGCRHVLLMHWKQQRFTPAFLERTRDFFMALGHSLSQSRVCRLACYTTAASFWKRGWFAGDEHQSSTTFSDGAREQELLTAMAVIHPVALHSKTDLFAYLDMLVQQQHLQHLALLVECLVSEFGTKSAVTYRMPLEFHKASHKSFEKDGSLLNCLRLAVSSTSQIMVNIMSHATIAPKLDVETCIAVAHVLTTIMGWEFGAAAWDPVSATTTLQLIRPPAEWSEFVGHPDFVQAVFRFHETVQSTAAVDSESRAKTQVLAEHWRQVLLQLASLNGPMYKHPTVQKQYASCLCEGTLHLMQQTLNSAKEDMEIIPFTLQMISRLVSNFRFSVLIELPTCIPLLECLTSVGSALLMNQTRECQQANGNIDDMPHFDWRNDTLVLLLDATVVLCSDTWLWYGGTEASRKDARLSLSKSIGPLYEGFVTCRTRMAVLEEYYNVTNSTDLDEIREGITEKEFHDDMEYIAMIGRLNPSAAIACLSSHFGATTPKLYAMWNANGSVTPETLLLLEEARLLTIYVTHLFTDDSASESPSLPDAILITCREHETLVPEIAAVIGTVTHLADAQIQAIARNPTDETLSPLLSKEILILLTRWVPVYICPVSYGSSNAGNRLLEEWSYDDRVDQMIGFCTSLCHSYQTYWPQEPLVQESVGQLLMTMAKRSGQMRNTMVCTPSFQAMVRSHSLTMGLRQSSSQAEFEASTRDKTGNLFNCSAEAVWGCWRLPHKERARVFTVILIACSSTINASASNMLNDCLKSLHEAFLSLDVALSTRQINPEDVDARELACLCVEMFCGITQAIEMENSERVPHFLSNYLLKLSGWMSFYANDLTLGTLLLCFFRDYSANFITLLDNVQSVTLFQACTELLQRYSEFHCSSRIIKNKSTAETAAYEEQSFEDVTCAIQLLIQLGTKDFIDTCSTSIDGDGAIQVTDVIFVGLQHILPLMTQGLLQFPSVCSQFFDLVGFMMDTYPEKVGLLPRDLFASLLESLLFGMSHQDCVVAKCSLLGLTSLIREHLRTNILKPHLEQRPDMIDRCSKRLLAEVIVQPLIVDRVEAAGMLLLPLAACNVDRFSAVVSDLSSQVPDQIQQTRLLESFSKLMHPEVITKVNTTGYEGRANRVRFKKDFEEFVNEINAFLILR